MTIADYLADQLFIIGIRHIFGVPGGASIPWIEAFRNRGIEFVLTTGEAAAGVMADVSYRLTGIPGVCHATFGPGATNISTGTGGAFLDRSSVIVLTSEMDDLMIRRTTQMNINHQELFKPLTKATFRLKPENTVEILATAIKICREEYPGPVHIGLPADIAEIDIPFLPVIPPDIAPHTGSNNTEKIISLLENSRRPLIAAGLTARRLEIQPYLMSFLDKYNIPVVLTPMAKGIISEHHPSYAGVLFHALSDCIEDLYNEADLIIGIGYDPVEYNYESWIPPVPLLHFDTKETDMPQSVNVLQYAGQPVEWFNILGNLNAGALISEQTLINGIRDEMSSVFEGFTNHFGPVAALKILREELPADTIITADVGSHLHLAGQYWETGSRGNFIISNGWSGMGFGIPSVIAAAIAKPFSRSVCITGDGGFLMSAGEIMTARRYNLPIIVVVLSDGELNLIKLKQAWKDIKPCGTNLYYGELFGSDIFLGVKVLKADSPETMRKSVNTALMLKEPVIIDAIIDPDDYKWLVVKR
ncbi:MAG: thiamine pyrophosphate-binding protein [Bacteroidetes bacterium]|nr:thiamine pyrophosphate-binding protein [Bacteroidota bacterium]